jgi:DNA adenine methylase
MTQEIIQNIATKINVHPIHLRFFLSNIKIDSSENMEILYKQYVDENPKPFVKWVGGKRQLLRQFREMNLYPPFAFNPDTATYFEPFAGGGAMFFDLLPKRAVLSDMNKELVTTYNIIKNDNEKFN